MKVEYRYPEMIFVFFVIPVLLRFPHSEPERLKIWLRNMKWKKWTPKKSSLLCSEHFLPECFDRTGQTTRLRAGTAPTIFNFPDHLKKVGHNNVILK